MKTVAFLLFCCLELNYGGKQKAHLTISTFDKVFSQDTTSVEYWKQKARAAEKEANQNRKIAEKVKRDLMESEKKIEELNRLVEEQKKQIQELKSKNRG